jgi:hypothetical protein
MESNERMVLLLATAVLLMAGCAATNVAATDDPLEDKVYRTGSHIAVRDSALAATQHDPKVVDDMRRNSTLTNSARGASSN